MYRSGRLPSRQTAGWRLEPLSPLTRSKPTLNVKVATVPPASRSGLLITTILAPPVGAGTTPGTANMLNVTATHLSLNPTHGKAAHNVFGPSPSRVYEVQVPVGLVVCEMLTAQLELADFGLPAHTAIHRPERL